MTYKNGQLPDIALVSVGVCDLWWGTAHAFKEAQVAAFNDGVGLAPINSYSGYRSLALQRDGLAHPSKYGVDPKVHQLPAGKQTHGDGTCVDVISGFSWFVAHGAEYGFHRDIAGDKYHFHHDGKTAIGTDPANVGPVTPVTDTSKELILMATIRYFSPTTSGTNANPSISLGKGQFYTFADVGGHIAIMADSPAQTTAKALYGAPDTTRPASFWIEAAKVAKAAAGF